MGDACPAKMRQTFPGRDVCIVGCVPADACAGANWCGVAYQSKAPYYRCAGAERSIAHIGHARSVPWIRLHNSATPFMLRWHCRSFCCRADCNKASVMH